jgi:hypothetical protein
VAPETRRNGRARTMETYDPDLTPDPEEWLDLEEGERIHRIASYHRQAKISLPNTQIHAAIHTVVENQIAEGLQSVREAVERLQSEGLSRHDALHAIGSVLVKSLHALLRKESQAPFEVEAYSQELRSLTAEAWLKLGSEES